MASITTLRGRRRIAHEPGANWRPLRRRRAVRWIPEATADRENRIGNRWRRCGGSGVRPRRRPARGLAGKLHERAARRRAAPALPLGEQLGDQATQLIACERHAARAEVVVNDLADGIGDLRRRAAVAEGRRHLARHPIRKGAPGLLHQLCATGIAAQGKISSSGRARPSAGGRSSTEFRASGLSRAALRRPWRSSDNPIIMTPTISHSKALRPAVISADSVEHHPCAR